LVVDEYGTYGYDGYSTGAYETGTYAHFDSTAVAYAPGSAYDPYTGHGEYQTHDTGGYPVFHTYDTGTYETGSYTADPREVADYTAAMTGPAEPEPDETAPAPAPQREPAVRQSSAPGRRRRTVRRSRRSTMLTVGVPSMAVMGVTAAAVSSVAAGHHEGATPQAEATPAQATAGKLDQQLSDVSHGADDFANRASRAQQRLDLKNRQAQEARRKAAEAARKEAMRPKFVLPVAQRGLSAYFGQAGINWMSVHTGIDFPVSDGTPVMAATDGTVRTKWNPSYGNMAIVTAPDGTETWYCHLSSTKIRTGTVHAGTVIAYSGNTGNTTGPHLHFEVRPHGGEPVDPLPWLTSHGLDPR
jgi:murein DD-endopeptidase MepM/ murein hydrolase activator NlpD